MKERGLEHPRFSCFTNYAHIGHFSSKNTFQRSFLYSIALSIICQNEDYHAMLKKLYFLYFPSMLIQYYGDACFKITTKPGGRATDDIIIWTNPPEKTSGSRSVQGQANIVLLSQPTNSEALVGLKGEPIVFVTPGEYASCGLTIKGIPSYHDAEGGSIRGQNTIYTCIVEEMSLCFLGLLGHTLTSEQLDQIGHTDILFIPIDGADTLSPHQADDIIKKIEPVIIVPMHYSTEDSLLTSNTLKPFCDEIGNCPEQTIPKLLLKKKDLEGKSMEVILLEKI